jgi:hypothetical protein
MKKALIKGTRIVQVATETFIVHPDFIWVDVPDDTVPGQDTYVNGAVVKPPGPTPEQVAERTRLTELDAQITGSATINSLKVMTNAQFDAWWTANVANLAQALTVLKLLARIVLRRLL